MSKSRGTNARMRMHQVRERFLIPRHAAALAAPIKQPRQSAAANACRPTPVLPAPLRNRHPGTPR
jgi:hypothetical protein